MQMALVHVNWLPELLSAHELVAEVWDEESRSVLFRGFRSRVGINLGLIDRVTPSAKTGKWGLCCAWASAWALVRLGHACLLLTVPDVATKPDGPPCLPQLACIS